MFEAGRLLTLEGGLGGVASIPVNVVILATFNKGIEPGGLNLGC
jgi:hypothetical protein